MLIKKGLFIVSLPRLLHAQVLEIDPDLVNTTNCLHLVRRPENLSLPCPALYICYNGHVHVCGIQLRGCVQRCITCQHDSQQQYLENCQLGAAPHRRMPCPQAED
ncbi:hypothetical protein PGT21_033472 [Puccinia graminis f. sp. tritici]|uniref:Secreted protein n=1 Tax=Puccinia graminis f. sp. tritici TaxID=56615 RepID=A0A5B0MQM3_PUCGR|nr:hypothetical protein PGT21_033472 [Puccinia graminis f. sp. tritici]